MVDEIICSSPPKFRFPEAGLRVMITNKFGPRTRLRMASRLIINERQRLIHSANGKVIQNGKHENIENGAIHVDNQEEEHEHFNQSPFSPPEYLEQNDSWEMTAGKFSGLKLNNKTEEWRERWENEQSQMDSDVAVDIPPFFHCTKLQQATVGKMFHADLPFIYSVDCFVFLLHGVAGLGDMAVSNSIGSNVFDILVGLGVPWGLQTIVINYGTTIRINSKGLVYSVALLLGSVALTVSGIHLNKWKLDKKLGFYVLFLYAIFLCFSIMIEFNVFTFVNFPMCREDD
uniref:Uncharacterized protein n=1 Tax=Sphaerodactylus townsendi TaxID=933632 RepID=A0ACB8G5M5_9SAUR